MKIRALVKVTGIVSLFCFQSGQAQTPSFAAAPDSPLEFINGAGAAPIMTVTADINGDGIPDLAIANFGTGRAGGAAIYLGNGDGSFTQVPSYLNPFLTNFGIAYVILADFNNDGKPDLAVVDYDYNSISVCLGNGDGTFSQSSSISYPVGQNPISMAAIKAGDLDGDGNIDLVVVNTTSNTLNVFLGQGNGTFVSGTPSTYYLGTGPFYLVTADFNGDGISDVAVTDNGSSSVTILLGNGNATFSYGSGFPVGVSPYHITSGDFNNDGKIDLAIANAGGLIENSNIASSVTVALGNGNGTFNSVGNIRIGSAVVGIAAADFNLDGNADLSVTDYYSGNVYILSGQGNGQFSQSLTLPGSAGFYTIDVLAADFNLDGKPDISISAQEAGDIGGGVAVYLNTISKTPINYTWNGSVSQNWATAANWTPTGVPSSIDYVTIVNGTYQPFLSVTAGVYELTINSGTLDLGGNTLNVNNGGAVFNGGVVNAGNLNISGNGSIQFSGTTFGANVYANSKEVFLNGSVFNGLLNITRTGNDYERSLGGNTFNGATSVTNVENGTLALGTVSPDVFNSNVTFTNNGTNPFSVADSSANNIFNGNVTANGNVYFGLNQGSISFAGTGDQTFNGSGGSISGVGSGIFCSNLGINKSSGSLQLNAPAFFINLNLTSGNIVTNGNGFTMITYNGITGAVTGGSSQSYVNGAMTKVGFSANTPFVFPVGAGGIYQPISVSDTNTSSTDEYSAQYFNSGQTLGYHTDPTITDLSTCEYWTLNQVSGANSVSVTLPWTSNSCNVNSPISNMRISGWNGNSWANLGGANPDSLSPTTGNITSAAPLTTFGALTLANNNIVANYTWNGSVSNNWFTEKNWTPNGIPNSADSVTIVSGVYQPTLSSPTSVGEFTINSGTLSLGSNTLNISGNSNFNGGTINGGSISIINNTATFASSTIGSTILLSCQDVYLNGGVFNGPVSITKQGGGVDVGAGGNTFNSTFSLNNNSLGNLSLGEINPDYFNGDITLSDNVGGGYISVADASAGTTIAGNVNISGTVYFGYNLGSIILNGTSEQFFNGGEVGIVNMQVNKPSGSVQMNTVFYGVLLNLTQGVIVTNGYPFNIIDALGLVGNVTGGNNSSYVDGLITKSGADPFTFPTGNNGVYNPISITAPGNPNDIFSAQYFSAGQPYGNATDPTINGLSSCEYWTLNRASGSDNVSVALGWTPSSCDVTSNISQMRVAQWNGTEWANDGGINPTGNTTTGTITSSAALTAYGPLTLANNACNITAGIGPNVTLCAGASAVLSASGGSTYSWSPSAGLSSTSIADPIATPTVTTTYTVTVSTSSSCSATATVTVTLSPTAAPTIKAKTSAATTCIGTAVTLTASGGTTYSWSTGATSPTISVSQNATTTYTVTGTVSGGCSNISTVTETIKTVGIIASAMTVCAGSSVKLSGNGGASTYSWTGGVTDGVAFVPSATQTYTVTGTFASGCTNTASVTITVNPLPTVSANQTLLAVCKDAGTDVTLFGSGSAVSYNWTGGVTNGVAFASPTATKTYTVTGTDGNGCQNTSTATITVNPLPTITVIPHDSTICAGNSIAFTATGAVSYVWTGGIINGVAFTPTATTSYTVTGTDVNGCVNTTTDKITVHPLPTVVAHASATTIDAGASVTLTGSGAGTGGSYIWTGGVTDGVAFAPDTTNSYIVTGTNSNGCSASSIITVTVIPSGASCSSAILLPAHNSLTIQNVTMSQDWYSFIPDSIGVFISISGDDSNLQMAPTIQQLNLYDGKCATLALIATDFQLIGGPSLSLAVRNLIPGKQYILNLTKSNLYASANVGINIQNVGRSKSPVVVQNSCDLVCNGTFSNQGSSYPAGYPFNPVYSNPPGDYASYIPCWEQDWGLPQISTTSFPPSSPAYSALLWAGYSTYGTGLCPIGYDGSSVGTQVSLKLGKEYYLSYSVTRDPSSNLNSSNTAPTIDNFFVGLCNYDDVMYNMYVGPNSSCYASGVAQIQANGVYIEDNLIIDDAADVSEPTGGLGGPWTQRNECFSISTTDQNYLYFYAQQNTTSKITYADFDDVSVQLLNDAGPAVTFSSCVSPPTIGPACPVTGATYSWSPSTGLSNPNIPNPTVSPTVTTTYTLTVTVPVSSGSGTCTSTDQVTVTVSEHRPAPPIIIGDNNNCAFLNPSGPATSIQYSVAQIAGLTYSWSTSIDALSCLKCSSYTTTATGNTINAQWPTISTGYPYVLTVVATDKGGCTATSSITIFECCGNPHTANSEFNPCENIENANVSSFQSNSCPSLTAIITYDPIHNNYTMQEPAGGDPIFLNGTLTVDGNLTIQDNVSQFPNLQTVVNMGPEAKIVVKSTYTLTINTISQNATTLWAGCNYMWDGIYVEPGATLNITSSPAATTTSEETTIEDAVNGIVLMNGSSLSNCAINKAYFLNDYIGMQIDKYSASEIANPITGSTFLGSSSLPYAPELGLNSSTGIRITDVDYYVPPHIGGPTIIAGVTIGDYTTPSNVNTFYQLDTGISAIRSVVRVYNSNFNGHFLSGTGSYGIGIASISIPKTPSAQLNIESYPPNPKPTLTTNRFNYNFIGVYANNYGPLNVKGAIMNYVPTGVISTDNIDSLQFNTISNSLIGIRADYVNRQHYQTMILDNTINNPVEGIYVTNVLAP